MKYFAIFAALVFLGIVAFALQNKKTETPQPTSSPKTQVSVLTAKLSAVGSYKGDGVATKSFDGKKFVHTATANLSDPSKGKFYEGWLVDKKPTLRFFSTGKMIKENGVYKLRFEANQDYPDYNDVVITEETESQGLDGKPEAHVLEGSFYPK